MGKKNKKNGIESMFDRFLFGQLGQTNTILGNCRRIDTKNAFKDSDYKLNIFGGKSVKVPLGEWLNDTIRDIEITHIDDITTVPDVNIDDKAAKIYASSYGLLESYWHYRNDMGAAVPTVCCILQVNNRRGLQWIMLENALPNATMETLINYSSLGYLLYDIEFATADVMLGKTKNRHGITHSDSHSISYSSKTDKSLRPGAYAIWVPNVVLFDYEALDKGNIPFVNVLILVEPSIKRIVESGILDKAPYDFFNKHNPTLVQNDVIAGYIQESIKIFKNVGGPNKAHKSLLRMLYIRELFETAAKGYGKNLLIDPTMLSKKTSEFEPEFNEWKTVTDDLKVSSNFENIIYTNVGIYENRKALNADRIWL